MVPVNLLILATALSFSTYTGFAVALSGSLLGGLASFLLGHWLGQDMIRKLAGKKLNRLSRRLARRGWIARSDYPGGADRSLYHCQPGSRSFSHHHPFVPDRDSYRYVSRHCCDYDF